MAALKCIAAARSGFLLAALHSVAERVNPRKARPPAPHGPRVLAKQRVPIWRCWEKSARLPRPGKNHNTESADLFHPRGSPRWLGIGNEAADRGGGGVRCGLRANGDRPRRVVRLPTADSLCDRMERGEEKSNARRRVASQRSHFGRRQGAQDFDERPPGNEMGTLPNSPLRGQMGSDLTAELLG